MKIDVDAVGDAIAAPRADIVSTGVSRRAVAKGVAWSLPVIASAVAAGPAYAASPAQCSSCTGAVVTNNCILSGGGSGDCTCAPGLICVGTGPLGLANVCVGTDLLVSTCNGTTCYGVCLAAGGAIINALNTFISAITTFATVAGSLVSLLGVTPCVHSAGLPTNLCISPFNDGRLGTLCSVSHSCGNTGVISVPLGVLTTAYNTLVSTLGALGILISSSCNDGYVCGGYGASVSLQYAGGLGPAWGFDLQLGICQCSQQGVCKQTQC